MTSFKNQAINDSIIDKTFKYAKTGSKVGEYIGWYMGMIIGGSWCVGSTIVESACEKSHSIHRDYYGQSSCKFHDISYELGGDDDGIVAVEKV